MVSQITEEDARRELSLMNSAAASTDHYRAIRRENGWLFGWRRESGRVPMGARSWVVADNGRARMLDIRDQADDVIAREMAAGARPDG